MDKVIGIDFGTTNSCVAVAETGGITVIPCEQGDRIIPSIVAFTDKNERLIGWQAKNQAIVNPEKTIYSVKRLIGRRFDSKEIQEIIKRVPYKIIPGPNEEAYIEIDGKSFNPIEIAAMIIRKLRDYTQEYLGEKEKVKDAVITVPAYYDNAQREATRNAAIVAGLNVLRIINEPTAASIAYGLKERSKDNSKQRIAIFDLGGGTFDISILSLYKGTFEVIATNGDTFLGGDDFDERILEYLVSHFKEETDIDLKNDREAIQRLKLSVEKAKHELSSRIDTEILVPYIAKKEGEPVHFRFSFRRAFLENLCSDLIDRLEEPCLTALEDSKLSPQDIDEVILVGGMTRMPKIQNKVTEIFGKPPRKVVDPDQAVAIGAAIEGSALKGTVKDILLLDVIPLSLGIETAGGIFTRIIEKNTTIPVRKSEIFTTTLDNQPMVSVHILQGEREMAQDNKSLGRFDLVGIPPAPRGYPQIEVTFEVDVNGILNVTARDMATNKKQGIQITSHGSISKEERERMIKEAEVYAEQDRKKKELSEKKNELESLIYNIGKSLQEYRDKLTDDQVEAIEKSINLGKETMKSNDIKEINNVIETINISMNILWEVTYKIADQKARDIEEGGGVQKEGKEE